MCYHIRAVAKVNPEVKTRLLAEGTWNDFCLFRDNAQKEGNTPAAAERLAVAKFCPDLAGLPRVPHRKGATAKAKEAVSVPSTSVSGSTSGKTELAAKGLMAMTGVSLEIFDGKSCTMVKALDWVIDMLALDPSQVRPETAPAAKAWSLYLMCRRSPSFAEDVISKAVVRQLPNGAREEETGDEEFAGEREYRLLEALKSEGVA